jgi:hypothetical protein
MSGSSVTVPFSLAAKLAGEREPGLGLSGPHLGSPQVLLDVEVGAALRCVDVVIEAL